MRKINKKANILTENLIFIILNLVFLAILILFLFSKMANGAVLEEKYAKQIALLVDSADPGMTIGLNMTDALEIAESKGLDQRNIVKIQDNLVTVQLTDKGYSYSFFNDVEASENFDTKTNSGYYFVITKNDKTNGE